MDKPGKSDSVFASHGKADTDSVVTVNIINEARNTGVLDLSGRGLHCGDFSGRNFTSHRINSISKIQSTIHRDATFF